MSERLPGLNMDTHMSPLTALTDVPPPHHPLPPPLSHWRTLQTRSQSHAGDVPIDAAHTAACTIKPRSCVTRLGLWGVFTDAAVPPPACLLWEEGGSDVQRSDVLSFPARRRHICALEAHIVWLSFSHILFLLCLKCSMTLCPWQSVLWSNTAPGNRICLASLPFFKKKKMFVYLSPINEKCCRSCVTHSFGSRRNLIAFFLSDCYTRLCSNG